MDERPKFLLILSGTITPAPGVNVSRRDPAVRRADYLHAFNYWLNHPDPRLRQIAFAENSGADLSEFRNSAARTDKSVEIISIPPNHPPPDMHYGYSELQMLDQALSQSQLRQQTTHMIKTTGRLIFPALPRLLDKLPTNLRLAVDARARLPFRPSEHGFISTQLFIARHDFYDDVLRKRYLQLAKENHYPFLIEHQFFDLLAHRKGEEDLLLRFPVNCEPVGFKAHAATQYNTPSRLLITKARAIARVVAPNFWL